MSLKVAIGVAAVALAVSAPACSAPYAPAGDWSITSSPTGCMLTREFSDGTSSVGFGVRLQPLGRAVTLMLTAPLNDSRDLLSSPGTLAFGSAHWSGTVNAIPLNDERGLWLSTAELPAGDFETLERAGTIEVAFGAIAHLQIATPGLSEATGLVRNCEQQLMRGWGVDPASQAAIVTPARSTTEQAAWFRRTDDPRSDTGGAAFILWRISATGAPQNCRILATSDDAALDRVICADLLKRARFQPARNAAGGAVADYATTMVRWPQQ